MSLARLETVHGSPSLEAVTLRAYNPDSKSNDAKPDPPEILRISAAFVFIGADPGCAWLPESIARDNLGYILTGVDAVSCGGCPLKTANPAPSKPPSPESSPPATSAPVPPNASALPSATAPSPSRAFTN
jgi:hypothetical protein